MIGTIAGIAEALGKLCVTYSCITGLASVASGIVCLNGPWLVAVEAIRAQKSLNFIEVIAMILCLIGATLLIFKD